MATRQELLSAREQLHVAIHAAEEWQESYKASPDTFRLLLSLEAALETATAEYLHELSSRATQYVDWSRMPEPVKADAGPVANNDDPVWKQEQILLTAAVIDIITDLVATGAVAGETLYGIPIGYSTLEFASLDEAIMQAARKLTAEMVANVTETTRRLIRESVAKSIALGETADFATVRLMNVIDNPVRAQLIAQTEPVNAYQTGLKHYANQTGAKEKTWDGLSGACQICSPVIGKTIAIDGLFVLANGKEVDRPAGHVRCRCSLIYIY
jgi:P2-related tail formation protein